MKKSIIIGLISLILITSLFALTGCKNDKNTNSDNNNNNNNNTSVNNQETSIVGTYKAFETVQYGQKYTGEAVQKENISLIVREDKTATMQWGESKPKDYKIVGNEFIATDDSGEKGTYTYENGTLLLETSDGFSISFR